MAEDARPFPTRRDPERPRANAAVRLAGLAVVVALAVLAARHVDLRAVAHALARADPWHVALACGANVLSLALHSRRWAAVVRPPSVRIRFADAFWPVVAGFAAGLVVPARAGDVLRAWMLARRTGLSTATVVAAAALDYLVGAATLVPVLALVAIGTPLPGWARHVLLVFALVAAIGSIAVWFLRPPRDRPPPAPGAGGLVTRLRGGLAAAHEPRAIAASVAWGLGGWGAEVLIAWFTLAALGLPASFPVAALAVVATTAANVVVVSPGNAGPFELAAMIALAGIGGVERAPALAFALLYHLVHLVPVAVLGAWVALREAAARREA